MAIITSRTLRKSSRLNRLDDVLYTPPAYPLEKVSKSIVILLSKVPAKDIFITFPLPDYEPLEVSALILIPIEYEYERYAMTHDGGEPPWMKSAPNPLKAHLRRWRAVHSPEYEQFAIIFELPFSTISYVVLEDGLVQDAMNTFGLERLHYIKQLGYLQDPVTTGVGQKALTMGFDHTRYLHSLDVMAVATLLAHNNRLPASLTNTLRAAALTHDALTPAGGDTTKFIDPPAFDEDEHYGELLESRDWEKIRKKYRIDPEKLIATVQGKGVLGKLLDIADKTSYVSRDAGIYLGRYEPDGPIAYPESYMAIKDLLDRHPYATAVWDAVKVKGEQVIFSDPERLAVFLKLRALLFRDFYLHQGTRWQEAFLANVVIRYLYRTGQLTRHSLLQMRDPELDRFLEQKTGIPLFAFHPAFSENACVESFASCEAAKEREQILLAKNLTFILIEDLSRITKPATHYLVQTKSGVISPLRDAYPALAAEVEEIARIQKPFRLYYLRQDPPFNAEFLSSFRTYMNQRS